MTITGKSQVVSSQGNSSNGLLTSSSASGFPIIPLAIGTIGLLGLSLKFLSSMMNRSSLPPIRISDPLKASTADGSFLGLSEAQLSSLKKLVISGVPSNQVMDRLGDCRSLEKVTVENVPRTHLPEILELLPSSLKDLTLSNDPLSEKTNQAEETNRELIFDGDAVPNLENLEIKGISFSCVGCSNLTRLKRFDITGSFFESLELVNCLSLKSDGWTGLTSMRGCLNALTMKRCPKITALDLSLFTLLDDLRLAELDSLTELNLAGTLVYDLEKTSPWCSFTELSSLKKFIIASDSGLSLSALALLLPPKLEELEIRQRLEDFARVEYDFEAFRHLKRFTMTPFLNGNQLVRAGWHLRLKNGEQLENVTFDMGENAQCRTLAMENFPSLSSISGFNSLGPLERFEPLSCPALRME